MQIFDNKKLVFFTMNERSAKISLLIIEETEIYQNFCMQKKKKKKSSRSRDQYPARFIL
jgi:hypothetical protein